MPLYHSRHSILGRRLVLLPTRSIPPSLQRDQTRQSGLVVSQSIATPWLTLSHRLAWAFWHEHLDIVQQNPQWRDEIEWMLTTAESKFNMIFPPGFNQQLRCIRLHLDPVQATHRPLLIYVLIYIITLLFNLIFLQSLW